MGKWASQKKGGSVWAFGSVPAPGPSPTSWTAAPGAPGVITLVRLEAIPGGATQAVWRVINPVTGIVVSESGNAVGLTPGATYRVQMGWWNGGQRVSEYSPAVSANAG